LYEKEVLLQKNIPSPPQEVEKITVPKDSPSFDMLSYEKNTSVGTGEKYIIANLTSQELLLKEGGTIIKSFPILSIGKPGSYYETPGGSYTILQKEETHFSSIGKVYTDYSLQFFGNFFIHGWPYYPDGTPVAPGYSGGCIRLSNEDAREVYEFASLGSRVIVISQPETHKKEYDYMVIGAPASPKISAKSYIVQDSISGETILAFQEDVPRPIASLTKLVTALTSLDILNQEKDTLIDKKALETEGSSGGLYAGQKIKIGYLLYPLLLSSSNDAAEALASVFPRNYFLDQMNKKALAIGMTQTTFEDPSGLSALNTSTARDISTLLRYIAVYKKYVLLITQEKEIKIKEPQLVWQNNSLFKNQESYKGGKSGETFEAGKTYAGLFESKTKDGSTHLFSIVILGSSDGVSDVKKLLLFIEKNIDAHKIKNTL
jgi:D-alanyl-D-alanine carboxypeptidase